MAVGVAVRGILADVACDVPIDDISVCPADDGAFSSELLLFVLSDDVSDEVW